MFQLALSTRSNKEQQQIKYATEEKNEKRKSALIAEVDPESPEQSIDDVEKKTMESTPMPNTDERETKTIEFSPMGNGTEITCNTPENI